MPSGNFTDESSAMQSRRSPSGLSGCGGLEAAGGQSALDLRVAQEVLEAIRFD
jgi:hypothetical protein